jgi:peptidoglycan/xylan/chitin deacetylase (PgdA/CDA1 family)
VAAAALAFAAALLGGCGSQRNRRPAAPGSASATSHGAGMAPGQGSAGSGSSSAGGPTGETPQVRALIALGKPIYCGARRGNEVALTFDDGPGVYTRLVLAKLRKHGIQATFFDVSRNIPLLAGATREEAAIGGLGDHTINHPLLTGLTPAGAQAEIAGAQSALERASGTPVFLFRPPYGGRSEGIDAIARSHGMLEIMWTVDSADSLGGDYAQIERNVIAGLHGGAIILMHENHGQTVRALLGIFAALQRQHVRTVSVASLLSDDPPSAAQVRAGGAGCGVGATRSNGG